MSKDQVRKVKHPLLLGMAVYALVFLAIAAAGLAVFWNYMEAYEASRPTNAIEAYVAELTEEYICGRSQELIDQIDHDLQSEEECRAVLTQAVSGGVTFAKKTSECTDEQMVYVLRCGSRVIGTVTMTTGEAESFGFANWQVTGDSFDLSYLLSEGQQITVPSGFRVSFNGTELDERYIQESGIRYTALEEFYDDYELPTMVTYAVPPILVGGELSVTDGQGNPVVIDGETDMNAFLDNCTQEELDRLKSLADVFLERYVAFTGSAHKSSETNYVKLLNYVVSGSDLHNRMRMALDGLGWAQSNGDILVSVVYNRFVNIGDGRYLCDATYEVDTYGREGLVRTTNYVKFIIVETSGGLKVEMLATY